MVDAVTPNKLEFPDIGNALAKGAQARYYGAEAQAKENEANALNAARPDIAAAIGGDQAAQGRVAQASPTTFAHIAPHIAKLDADKRAQVKSTAEAVSLAANTFLQTAPSERDAIYPQIVETLKSQGHDTSKMPPMMTEAQARAFRGQSLDTLKLLQQQEDEKGRNARHAPSGGLPFDAPSWATPAPAAAGPRADAGPMPGAPPVSVAQAAPPAMPQPAPQMAQAAPMPPAEPQIVQGDAPGPTPQVTGPQVVTPPGTDPAPAAAAVPPGFQPMGHRTPDGQLVPAQIDGKPVYRNAQTGEMRLGDAAAPQAVPAAAPPTRAPAPNGIVHAMPPGYEMVRQKGIPVVKDGYVPIISQNGPPLLFKPDDKVASGYEADPASPGAWRPIKGGPADKAGTEIDSTLRGDELLKSLDPGEAAQVQGVLDGRIPLPSLSARMAPEAKRLRQLAFQADPNFDSTVFASRAATQKDMADGKLAVQRTAADKLIAHMGELHEVSAELNNSSTPLFNKLGNLIAANRGDPRIAKFEATKHLVSEEATKFFSGTGGATVSGIEEMSKLINSAQSPQQLQGVMTQISKLMNGQIDAMAEQYNRGMRYTGDKAVKGESLLSKSAQDALAHIKENPLGGKPAGAVGNLKQLYGLE